MTLDALKEYAELGKDAFKMLWRDNIKLHKEIKSIREWISNHEWEKVKPDEPAQKDVPYCFGCNQSVLYTPCGPSIEKNYEIRQEIKSIRVCTKMRRLTPETGRRPDWCPRKEKS